MVGSSFFPTILPTASSAPLGAMHTFPNTLALGPRASHWGWLCHGEALCLLGLWDTYEWLMLMLPLLSGPCSALLPACSPSALLCPSGMAVSRPWLA